MRLGFEVCDHCGRQVPRGSLRRWIHSEDAPIRFTFHNAVRVVEFCLCAECHAAAAADEAAWHAPTRRTTAVIAALLVTVAVVSAADLQFWPHLFRFLFGPSTQELADAHNLWAAPAPWPTRSPLDKPADTPMPPR